MASARYLREWEGVDPREAPEGSDLEGFYKGWHNIAKFLLDVPGEWHIRGTIAERSGYCKGPKPPTGVIFQVIQGFYDRWGQVPVGKHRADHFLE